MYWCELLFLWTQCYVILTVLNVCTSIGWIIFSHSYLHVTHDEISRHRENFWAFTGPKRDFGLILLILNMIIHRSFTGPTHLLSANVRGPVSFVVSEYLYAWLFGWFDGQTFFVIKVINTPGHVLSPGWPLCKRSGLTLIEVSQHAYSSYQAFSLPFIFLPCYSCNLM